MRRTLSLSTGRTERKEARTDRPLRGQSALVARDGWILVEMPETSAVWRSKLPPTREEKKARSRRCGAMIPRSIPFWRGIRRNAGRPRDRRLRPAIVAQKGGGAGREGCPTSAPSAWATRRSTRARSFPCACPKRVWRNVGISWALASRSLPWAWPRRANHSAIFGTVGSGPASG